MPEMSLGNGYSIDLADGWTFVHALEDSRDQLRAAWFADGQRLKVPAPGNDGHSQNYSSSMTRDAVQKHRDWYLGQVQSLETMIQNATSILQQYGITETANTIQWNSADSSSSGSNNLGKGGGRGAS
jgi:hypothetical protein